MHIFGVDVDFYNHAFWILDMDGNMSVMVTLFFFNEFLLYVFLTTTC